MQDQKLRDKANDQRKKFFQIFKDLNFNISFVDALILMLKFGPTIKSLLTNKDKLCELARTPLNEHCSAVLLKKLPEKLGDPGKFFIPCDFPEKAQCLALVDLGASINLMPLSIWKRLSLPDLTPTYMTLELADLLISRPVGVAEDVYVKTGRALMDMFEGESTLRVGKEAITFNLDQTLRYSANYSDMTTKQIDVINMACEENSQEVLGFLIGPTSEKSKSKIHDVIKQEVLKLLDARLIYPISGSPWVSPVHCVSKKGGFTVVENEFNELIPTGLVTGWRVCVNYRKLNESTCKDHFPLPFMDQMLERLAGNQYYCFLDGFSVISKFPSIRKIRRKPHSPVYTERLLIAACLLGYAMHQERFRGLTRLLEKDTLFIFSKECVEAFQTLKRKLTKAPILIAPDWDMPFELMCDASDFGIGAVLGQRQDKHFRPVHYASKTMTKAESNYTTTKKEMLAVVYAFEKFWSYLIMNKSIVYTDHSALKYLFAKKDSKARLIRWVLLLQEFAFKVIDTKGAENLAVDHLSRLENPHQNVLDPKEINE
nr:hypothetical protein [Tanacetum cinerariifolium]